MDFVSIVIFLVAYFIRPQDWIPGFMGRSIVNPIMGFAILAMFFRRDGFRPSELVKTPLDWMVVTYYAYIVFTSPESYETFKAALPLFAFYFVTRQAITDSRRLKVYLTFWTACLLVVAAMAVASTFGLDLTKAAETTERMNGRLVLNTYLFNNPNALGHSVMVAIPLVYFLMFWRRSFLSRLAALPLLVLAGYCVYLTQSKGAFLVGFATCTVAMMFGRPKIFQIVILVLALTCGAAALMQLPRMGMLNRTRSDEAIVGRLLAWELARTASRELFYGEGFQKFNAVIMWEGEAYPKATHSSYVKVGADLGYPGLFMFVGILYCGMRVLMQAKTSGDEEERSRRMLFAILFSYCVSNWMIDRPYHSEFFLMAACISALHLILRGEAAGEVASEDVEEEGDEYLPAQPLFSPALRMAEAPSTMHEMPFLQRSLRRDILAEESGPAGGGAPHDRERSEWDDDDGENPGRREFNRWHRLGLVDIGLMALALWLTIQAWDYILKNF